MIETIISLIFSLILIVVVLFLTYYFLKVLSKKMTSFSNSKYIKVIDRVAITQNKFLLIVDVGEEKLLLSVSDNNISLVKKLDNLIIDEMTDVQNESIKFSEVLKDNLLKSKITSKFMKGNSDNDKADNKMFDDEE